MQINASADDRGRARARRLAAVSPLSRRPGEHSRLVVHVDGGARGNPGPAAIGSWSCRRPTGRRVDELGERIGVATNNVAEYRALLRGVERASRRSGLVRSS